jgi:TrmH family RNA methyltransferase
MSRMNLPSLTDHSGLKKRFAVILVRPESPENIGLVARSMKNTGFEMLRLIQVAGIDPKSCRTAVHSKDILEKAALYADLNEAVEDIQIVFAATAKKRKNFPLVSLNEAVKEIFRYPPETRIGLLFGNERTGLTSEELRSSNFRFMIPQSGRQPSYNLASAVLLTLFHISAYQSLGAYERATVKEEPLSRKEQQECIRLVIDKLEKKRFIHETNRQHMTEMVYGLFGRLSLTDKDRKLILALFSKTIGD